MLFKLPANSSLLIPSTDGAKYQANVEAIKLLRSLQSREDFARDEEKFQLAQYTSWGNTAVRTKGFTWKGDIKDPALVGMLSDKECISAAKSTLNAHFTELSICHSLWAVVSTLQQTKQAQEGGNVSPLWILEPGCGVGNFIGTIPGYIESRDPNIVGVEIDGITADIAAAIYPEVAIKKTPLESAELPEDHFDIVIGNVPFGDFATTDPSVKFGFLKKQIHDYFIAKSVIHTKPGGIICLITSKGTLDKKNNETREWLAKQAHLIGAIRLPETAFKAVAGTSVVTDVLFFQKRYVPLMKTDSELWVNTKELEMKEGTTENGNERKVGTYHLNEYFSNNPQQVLGTYAKGGLYGGDSVTVIPYRGTDGQPEDLTAAIEHATQDFKQSILAHKTSTIAPIVSVSIPETPICTMARRIYQAAKKVLKLETNGSNEQALRDKRKILNSLYDGFVGRFGTFRSNIRAKNCPLAPIKNESWYFFLLALETLKGNKESIFLHRTITAQKIFSERLDPKDALYVCLDQYGIVDLPVIAGLAQIPLGDVVESLKGLIYRDPDSITDRWLTADDYLTGHVREKLNRARNAATLNKLYEENVTALLGAQPEPLGPTEVAVPFGACWVPPSIYVEFLKGLFNSNRNWGISLSYVEPTATWIIDCSDPSIVSSVENLSIYGTTRVSGLELITGGLNLKLPIVYDEIENSEGKKTRIKNETETVAAQGKLLEIRARWDSWVFQDEDRAKMLCDEYNTRYNGYRVRQYDGSHLTFPGLCEIYKGKPFSLRTHQRSGVARIIGALRSATRDNSAFLVYLPGFGKTAAAICGIAKAIQLGMIGKAAIVVPKHTLVQWREEFTVLYPGMLDEILMADEDSFNPDNRKRFLSQIATGKHKAVIMTLEQFRSIPMAEGTFKQYLEREVADLRDHINDAVSRSDERRSLEREFKRREKALAKFETKYKKRWEKLCESLEDAAPTTWEDCNFDCVAMDEAHFAKNDMVFSKMENVAGLPKAESQRAFDTRVKVHYVLERGGKAIGLTGTPLTNTLAECFVWTRLFQPKLLKKHGLWHFDSWASVFTEPFSSIEMDTLGNFRTQTRLRFQNIPELLAMLAEAWDRATDSVEIEKPSIANGQVKVVEVAGSESLIAFTKRLAERADLIRRRKVLPKEDNFLKLTSDGKKASFFNGDPALRFQEGIRTKVDALAEETWSLYKATYAHFGTQLIFCDLFCPKGREAVAETSEDSEDEDSSEILTDEERWEISGIYGVIKEKLCAQGIIPEHVEFIHDAQNDEERSALYDRMRKGITRVLIGSTGKLGTGVNVQDCVIAIHHLDCPWRPDELEQRTARGVRQGNKWKEVHVLCYVTQRSYDPVIWQMIETKGRFIAQIMAGNVSSRRAEDIGNTIVTASMAKAIAMGDLRILDKIKLETELLSYERQYRAWLDSNMRMRFQASRLPGEIEIVKGQIEKTKLAIDFRDKHPAGSTFICHLRNLQTNTLETYTDLEAANDQSRRIAEALKSVAQRGIQVGNYRGFGLHLDKKYGTLRLIARHGKDGYEIEITSVGYQHNKVFQQLGDCLALLETQNGRMAGQIAAWQHQLETIRREVDKPWQNQAYVLQLLDRYKAVCAGLTQNGLIDEVSYDFRFIHQISPVSKIIST